MSFTNVSIKYREDYNESFPDNFFLFYYFSHFFQKSYAGWEIVTSKDETTGKKSCYAISPIVSPIKPMDSPYSNTKAWLGVGYNGNG